MVNELPSFLTQPPGEAAMSMGEDRSSGANWRILEQAPGLWRADLHQHDLSVSGREVVQQRVGVGHEAPLVKHTHLGEKIIYILEGSREYRVEDRPPRTCSAKDARTVPPGAVPAVRDVGSGKAELACVVKKRKPVISLAE